MDGLHVQKGCSCLPSWVPGRPGCSVVWKSEWVCSCCSALLPGSPIGAPCGSSGVRNVAPDAVLGRPISTLRIILMRAPTIIAHAQLT